MSTLEAYRGVEVHLLSFLIPALSDQFHFPDSLLPGKQPPVSFGCEVISRFVLDALEESLVCAENRTTHQPRLGLCRWNIERAEHCLYLRHSLAQTLYVYEVATGVLISP